MITFNAQDYWQYIHLWLKVDTFEQKNWWINFKLLKKNISKKYDCFDDLKQYNK